MINAALQKPSDTQAAHGTLHYRPEVDGLRALAVLAVIFNHFNRSWLPSGYLGVDIFFVISGYVITSSLLSRRCATAADFFLGFYSRRVKRILPALLVFVLVSGCAIAFVSPTGSSLRTGVAAIFGLSNLYLFRESQDYFAQASELNMFLHTWSLGVEEQFYFFYPLLVWSSGIARAGSSVSRRRLFLAILVCSVISLLFWLFLNRANQVAAYFLMPARLWELGVGCLVFLALHRLRAGRMARAPGAGLAVVLAMITVLFLPESATVIATPSMILLAALFLIVVRRGELMYRIFAFPAFVFIGLISYSLYLWHWGVLCISRWTIGSLPWMVPFQLGLIFILAYISYRWVETPLRKAVWSPRQDATVIKGVVAAFISAGLLLVLSKVMPRVSPVRPNPELSYDTHLIGWKPCNKSLMNSIVSGSASSSKEEDFCREIVQPPYPARLVLIGDSHAGQLASGLRDILPALPTSVVSFREAACFPLIDSKCAVIREGFEWALRSPSADLILMAGYHNLVINQNRYHWPGIDITRQAPGALHSLEQSLERTIATLTASGKSVVMVVDSHELMNLPEENIVPLTGRMRSPGSLDVSREQVERRNHSYYQMLDRLAKRYSGFHVFYSGRYFCHATACRSDLDGRPLFQTRDHLTPYASRVLAHRLQPLLQQLLVPSGGRPI